MAYVNQLVIKVGLPLLGAYIFFGLTGLGIACVIVYLINVIL